MRGSRGCLGPGRHTGAGELTSRYRSKGCSWHRHKATGAGGGAGCGEVTAPVPDIGASVLVTAMAVCPLALRASSDRTPSSGTRCVFGSILLLMLFRDSPKL
jgi:hypothetical protein